MILRWLCEKPKGMRTLVTQQRTLSPSVTFAPPILKDAKSLWPRSRPTNRGSRGGCLRRREGPTKPRKRPTFARVFGGAVLSAPGFPRAAKRRVRGRRRAAFCSENGPSLPPFLLSCSKNLSLPAAGCKTENIQKTGGFTGSFECFVKS